MIGEDAVSVYTQLLMKFIDVSDASVSVPAVSGVVSTTLVSGSLDGISSENTVAAGNSADENMDSAVMPLIILCLTFIFIILFLFSFRHLRPGYLYKSVKTVVWERSA